jgi:uncharacterized integral membrane protein
MVRMKNERIDDDTTAESGTAGPPWKLLALLIVAAGLAAFIFQNGHDAPVEFLWLDGSWPVWTVIGISTIVGVVLDRLATWQWRRSRRVR